MKTLVTFKENVSHNKPTHTHMWLFKEGMSGRSLIIKLCGSLIIKLCVYVIINSLNIHASVSLLISFEYM